jgi:hypothetical protein
VAVQAVVERLMFQLVLQELQVKEMLVVQLTKQAHINSLAVAVEVQQILAEMVQQEQIMAATEQLHHIQELQ